MLWYAASLLAEHFIGLVGLNRKQGDVEWLLFPTSASQSEGVTLTLIPHCSIQLLHLFFLQENISFQFATSSKMPADLTHFKKWVPLNAGLYPLGHE